MCECSIRYKIFSNGVTTPAIICDRHLKYIDWLTHDNANMLIDQLDMPIKTWHIVDKKTHKKRKSQKNLSKEALKKSIMKRIVNTEIKKYYPTQYRAKNK